MRCVDPWAIEAVLRRCDKMLAQDDRHPIKRTSDGILFGNRIPGTQRSWSSRQEPRTKFRMDRVWGQGDYAILFSYHQN